MSVPVFKSRAEQLDYVFRRFIDYIGCVFLEAGIMDVGLGRLREAPSLALFGKALEIAKKYGEGLKTHDMGVVFKIIVDNSGPSEPDQLAKNGVLFVDYLKANTETQAKFFLYTDVILNLLE